MRACEWFGALWERVSRVRISWATTPVPHALSWTTELEEMGGARASMCRARSRVQPPVEASYAAAALSKIWDAFAGASGILIDD